MKKTFLSFYLSLFLLNTSWAFDCSQDLSGSYRALNISFAFEVFFNELPSSELKNFPGVPLFVFSFNKDENGDYLFKLDQITKEAEIFLSLESFEMKNSFLSWLEKLEQNKFKIKESMNGCQVINQDGYLFAEIDDQGNIYSWYLLDQKKVYDHFFSKLISK